MIYKASPFLWLAVMNLCLVFDNQSCFSSHTPSRVFLGSPTLWRAALTNSELNQAWVLPLGETFLKSETSVRDLGAEMEQHL